MLFRAFRFLRAISHSYALGVFWLYVGFFILAFTLVFIFPPGALFMVFFGLAGLLLAKLVGVVLKLVEHTMARSLLRSGICPGCAESRTIIFSMPTDDGPPDQPWTCPVCGAAYLRSGCELEPEISGT